LLYLIILTDFDIIFIRVGLTAISLFFILNICVMLLLVHEQYLQSCSAESSV